MALTDDAGATKTSYIYDAFGNVSASGETSSNPFQYTGRENDGTGLFYYRARYYDPIKGRFISKDPIEFEGGDMNLYRYVGGNPTNLIDPMGLWWVYQQSTGNLFYYNDIFPDGLDLVGTGYAGKGICRNNPECQNKKDKGPLPQEVYTIGPQQDNQLYERDIILKDSMRLEPKYKTNTFRRGGMFGRKGFLMHEGDMIRKNSSRGCIVIPKQIRDIVGRSGDKTLVVVP